MANNIEKVDLIQKMLDKAMVQGAVTGFMEANAGPVKYSGGDEIKIPSIAMDGLKDYDRQLGFAEGDVTLVYQTERLTQDRGTGFTVDEMEVDESGVLDLMSLLAGEFQRTRVVPEVDSYRLSKIASWSARIVEAHIQRRLIRSTRNCRTISAVCATQWAATFRWL